MSFNMNQMGSMIKKMQDDMARVQKELEEAHVTGEDPSKKVSIKVNGHKEAIEVKIDPAAIDPDDPQLLEDLVLFAIRDALAKADACSQEKMGSVTKGMPNIPGLKMPW